MSSAVAANMMFPPHRLLSALCFLSVLISGLTAQTVTYDWDADANASNGITNGTGDWNTTGLNWRDELNANGTWANTYTSIARFGNAARVSANTVTIYGTMKLGGIDFASLITTAQSVSGQQYTLNGGTAGVLDFGTNGVITMADGSSGGSPFVTMGSALSIQGTNLTVRKSGGTTTQFITFLMTSNPQLTGTLTVGGANGGIFLRGNPNTFGALDKIVVEANGTFSMTSAGNYNKPFEIAGFGGANQYGAIRVDASNTTLSGLITLTADAAIQTNTGGITGTLITGGITEASPGLGFGRYAPGVGTGTFTLAAPSNYTGATTLGRSGFAGGINILDFSAAAAPVNDLIYNNVPTAGPLNLIGGTGSVTVLQVNGKASTANSQRFGNVTASGLRSTISATSGAGGSVNLTLGSLARTGNGLLTLIKPQSGSIQVGNADGFLGPWATVIDTNGESHWASAVGGELEAFTGDTDYTTGMDLSTLPADSHLRVTDASSGAVDLAAGTTGLGTLTLTDSAARAVALGTGKTLRLGVVGGIQMAPGAGDLTFGELGASGSLSAGGTVANATGHLILSNQTKNSVLTIHSPIVNNGTGSNGAVTLQINGVPGSLTVLTAASTYTGGTSVAGGALEIRHANALGTTGTITVLENASLRLNGGLTMTRSFTVAGSGLGGEGVFRSIAGNNTITGSITQASPSKLVADSGSLTIVGAAATTVVISGTHALTFGGAGNITVTGRISTSSGTTLKEGSGELTLQGSNISTGAFTLNGGTLNLDFSPTTAPTSNILYNGVTAGAMTQNAGVLKLTGKSGASVSQALGAYTVGGPNAIRVVQNGATQVNLSFTTITRSAGGTLALELPTTGAITTTSGTNNALLTGTGGVAYATVGLNDWAATTTAVSSVRNIVGLSSLNLYTASAASSLAAAANIDAIEPLTTLSADTSVATLRFNTAQATTLTQDTTGGRYLTTGGILVTPAVGAFETVISTAFLRAPASATDLVIIQNNTAAPLRITSKITNNAAASPGATGLTKTGPGTLILESTTTYTTGGTYTGTTRIREGILQLVSGTGSAITYPLYPSADFILGSNDVSAKLVIGSGAVAMNPWGGLRIEGTGTANAVVGGATAMSSFHHYADGVHDFRRGFLGGSGPNENNLSLTLSAGTLQLGPVNTFIGKVTLLRNTVEVEKLANIGEASSLGTGSYNAAAAIIDMGTQTTSSVGYTANATIRYIGSTDSVTNRPLYLANSDPEGDVAYAIATLENTGTGTVKFTAPFTVGGNNKAQLIFRLGGTNTGANEIVSIPELTVANPKAVQLEKNGTGTWILTGTSTHTGGTIISNGLLQLGNGGTGGSINAGPIMVQSPGVLGLSRSDRHEVSALISGNGSLTVTNGVSGVSVLSNDNNALTGGTRVLSGSLLVNNPNGVGSPAGYGTITVAANATLGGSGRIAPATGQSITLTGGRLSVGLDGMAAGLLTLQTSGLGSLSLLEDAVLSLDLFGGVGLGDNTGDAAAADRVSIGGAVVLGTGATLQVLNLSNVTTFAAGDSWKLFDWSNLSSLQGSFTQFDLPTLSSELEWDFSQLYTHGVLSVAMVPEPGRAMLLGFAVVGFVMRRRRA
ncbi:PEP-CTERM protein-sorting domain-containing protein [Prosthecobacter debontii]|uniref:PEP-CTERM protein-sorting domain-containing protein n=2 Tax=Prosthecobacter debontii TaxID=48467 RepID=A0A1T4XFC9_9BACT|nr:PEP-CTERM protein-sorting domain-containing protein [Prosthecobacter debontii]